MDGKTLRKVSVSLQTEQTRILKTSDSKVSQMKQKERNSETINQRSQKARSLESSQPKKRDIPNSTKQQKITARNTMQMTPDFHSKTASTVEQEEKQVEESTLDSSKDSKVEEHQTVSRSLSVPSILVSSETLELARNNRPRGDTIPNEDIQHLCVPTTGVEKIEKNISIEIENGMPFSARSISSPKLQIHCMSAKKRSVPTAAEKTITGQSKEGKDGGNTSRAFVSRHLEPHDRSLRLQRGQRRSRPNKMPDSGKSLTPTMSFPGPQNQPVLDDLTGEGQQNTQAEGLEDQVLKQEHIYCDKTSRAPLSPRTQYKSRSPVLQQSTCLRYNEKGKAHLSPRSPRRVDHVQIEKEGFRTHNMTADVSEQNRVGKSTKEGVSLENRSRSPSSPNFRVNNRRPSLRERSWSMSYQGPNNAGEVDVNIITTSPRSALLKKTQQKDSGNSESLNAQAWEMESFPKEKERAGLGNSAATTGASSPRPQLKRGGPNLQRGKSMPSLDCKVSQIANNSNGKDVYSSTGERISKKDIISSTDNGQGNNGQKVSQTEALSSKEPKMLQRRGWKVSNYLPQLEKSEMLIEAGDRKCPDVTIEVDESEDHVDKVGFCDIKPQLPLPFNHPNSHLSVIGVPRHRRSTGDIYEACAEELHQKYQETDNAPVDNLNGHKMKSSPEMRRLTVRNRASSMSRLHELSKEKKNFPNITAFNLATQNPSGHKTAVKFREIMEPVKKSKWFHALTSVVTLDYFQTAMMEIQKQKDREKASAENRPSIERTFEEIKNCRYLRVPEHYQ